MPFFICDYIHVHNKLTTLDIIPIPPLPTYAISQSTELVEQVGVFLMVSMACFYLYHNRFCTVNGVIFVCKWLFLALSTLIQQLNVYK